MIRPFICLRNNNNNQWGTNYLLFLITFEYISMKNDSTRIAPVRCVRAPFPSTAQRHNGFAVCSSRMTLRQLNTTLFTNNTIFIRTNSRNTKKKEERKYIKQSKYPSNVRHSLIKLTWRIVIDALLAFRAVKTNVKSSQLYRIRFNENNGALPYRVE